MKAIGRLLVARDLAKADEIVKHLYIILLSEVQTSRTKAALEFFRSLEDDQDFFELMTDVAKLTRVA